MIESLREQIEAISFVRSAQVKDNQLYVDVVSAAEYQLRLKFPENFPLALPDVFLRNHQEYGFFPHVAWSGQLCYSDGQSLSINIEDPFGVIQRVVELAIEVLDDNETGGDPFWNEFEGYWAHQNDKRARIAMVEPTERFKELNVRVDRDGIPLLFFDRSNDEQSLSTVKESPYWGKRQATAYYCPLVENFGFPSPGEKITIDDIENAIQHMSADDIEAFEKARTCGSRREQSARRKNGLHVIFSQPRSTGGRSMVGISHRYGHQILVGNKELIGDGAIPLEIERLTRSHSVRRGGGFVGLAGQSIGVVGVGALGSRIVELLGASGATNLTLIDPDALAADNIFRHALPARYLSSNKAESMRDFLHARYPDMNVTALPEKIVAPTQLADLGLDVLIIAIGDPTLERAIAAKHPVPIGVTTWLDAMGLGGHAILDDESVGCLNCLYHRDNTPVLENAVAMVKPGEHVSRNLTGCTGTYVPFGAADAMQTAAIAVRLVVDRLTSTEPQGKYVYWKGSDDLAKREGVRTSGRFSESGTADADAQFRERLGRGCPVCRSRGA